MAEAAAAQTDRDLASVGGARALARRSKETWLTLAELSQERIDAIVDTVAAAATSHAEAFARLAVDEAGYGVGAYKIHKNIFACDKVVQFIRPMKTVGVIARHETTLLIQTSDSFVPVAAVVPSTNPSFTV